jgi:hypothetical protein
MSSDKEAARMFSVVDPGHVYDLHNMEEGVQQISFIKKEKDEDDELKTVQNGTTNEAVIQVLIHRVKNLNELLPSEHNGRVIAYLESALDELEQRTSDRVERGVEGTSKE